MPSKSVGVMGSLQTGGVNSGADSDFMDEEFVKRHYQEHALDNLLHVKAIDNLVILSVKFITKTIK